MGLSDLVEELNYVSNEIKTKNRQLQELKKRHARIENLIITFLQEHNLPGFKHNGKIYEAKPSVSYKKKKKGEKEEQIKSILLQSNVSVDPNVVNSVFNVFKSKPVQTHRLATTK